MTSGERIDNSQPDSQRGAIAQPLWQGLASEAVLWSLRAGSWLHRLDGAATMPTAGEPAEAHGSQAVPCAWGGHISWSPTCGMRWPDGAWAAGIRALYKAVFQDSENREGLLDTL